ncbi:cytochrome-c peroxidase [Flavobacterium sp.]|uniref:cytochrome-c peroxidase n=1 Tax=Flavobacterium sp. TaxID=239 RepID=UPI0028BDA34A|nr:cytochrome c peroxidase [Flavobacterium sp.]
MFSEKRFRILGLVVMLLGVVSFVRTEDVSEEEYTVNLFANLNRALEDFDKNADAFKWNKIGVDSLQQSFLKARLQYKKVEFLLAFHHPEYVNTRLNGAPLLRIEKENSNPLVIEPEGFQVLDELFFSDELANKKYEVASLAKKLKTNYGLLYSKIGHQPFKNTEDNAAMRMQLVRLYTMGLTGFDTPGSGHSLEDAKASLQGMQIYFEQQNKGKITNTEVVEIIRLFDETIQFLEKTDFENLDRYELLVKYINPLYELLGNVSKANENGLSKITAWNPNSDSLFSSDFLNPYYFTLLQKEEDSPELRQLGEALFFDPIISNDGKMSCASCHAPEKSFTDSEIKSLSSVKGKTVLRNSPTLLNAVYADRFFYDMRAFTLEQQIEHVIFSADEFNTAYETILKKLNNQPKYQTEFKRIFKEKNITREQLSRAMSSYVLSLQSNNSSFDKYTRGELKQIPSEVKNGYNLFMGKANCATCHFAPTFSGLVPPFYGENESEILGVFDNPNSRNLDSDLGRIANRIASESAWIYEKSFKTPTIRNIAETAPYFHNGAYKTLEEVVEFYNNGGGLGVGVSVQNQTLPDAKLNLTDKEKKELIAFMKSLSDNPYRNR